MKKTSKTTLLESVDEKAEHISNFETSRLVISIGTMPTVNKYKLFLRIN